MVDGVADQVSERIAKVLDDRGVDLHVRSIDETRCFRELTGHISNRANVLAEQGTGTDCGTIRSFVTCSCSSMWRRSVSLKTS